MLKAKEIVEDKFWIVEDHGEKVAIIQPGSDGTFVYTIKGEKERFSTLEQLTDKYDIKLEKGETSIIATPLKELEDEKEEYEVYDFPCKFKPYNEIFDASKKLPLFTKSEKSKSYHCAGYYIFEFQNGWSTSFCPKLITIERYPWKGPFKSKLEVRQAVKKANNVQSTPHEKV